MEFALFYLTFPSQQAAKKVGKLLLEEGLVACVNIITGVSSMYIWEGEFFDESEFILIGKSKKNLFEKIEKLVKKEHSYDCPCVLMLEINRGNDEFLSFIESNINNESTN